MNQSVCIHVWDPLLKTVITLDNFRAFGTLPDRNELLKSIFNGVDKTDFNSLRMSTDML